MIEVVAALSAANAAFNALKSGVEKGKELHFMGDDNFRAIARYNISDVYAMAVYYLSEEYKK